MISYALSSTSVGGKMTPVLAEAFRRVKIKNLEIFINEGYNTSDEYKDSRLLFEQEVKAGTIRPISIHFPFWDPSSPDEEVRKQEAQKIIDSFHANAAILGPNATLHASREPSLAEHPVRIDQICKTIEEIMPTIQKFGVSINIEYLPRTCVGNCVEELQTITSRFDPENVGICMDVNHVMDKYNELPDIITTLSSRIKTVHISDYDGIDELHWFPGQGLIDWPEVMRRLKQIKQDIYLIFETKFQLGSPFSSWVGSHLPDPYYALRQIEKTCWFLENCEEITQREKAFMIPGND